MQNNLASKVNFFGFVFSDLFGLNLRCDTKRRKGNQAATPILAIACVNSFADDPSRANTRVESMSRSMVSIYSAAPERWATLAHAA